MSCLLDLPDEIWHYIFRNLFLSVPDLLKISEVCTQLYKVAHEVKTFQSPRYYENIVDPLRKIFVKSWNNIAFKKYIPTSIMIKPDFHYIFHTWSDCPNVYFYITTTKRSNFGKIINQFEDRIYFYHCSSESIPDKVNIPLFSFSGDILSAQEGNLKIGKKVENVNIGFSNIKDLSPFKNINELVIKFSNNIDLSSLKNSKLVKINILDCNITSLDGIQGIKNVIISGRNQVDDFKPISKTPYLTLHNTYINNLNFIKEAIELDISESVNLTDVYCLLQVPTLQRVVAWRTRWVIGFMELRDKGVEVIR